MENLAQLAPAIILFPAIGALINYFWGAKMGEGASALVGQIASGLAFVVALVLLSYLVNNDYNPAVVNPPVLDSWIRIDSINIDIAWQTRVDTLSVSMMLFVTFVGTLIHIYAGGYMHGDERFALFFAYLNMFLTFMLILVSGNNFLMMFVGWEGVGLCSYLLISFWWDKPNGVGIQNSNAGRKAFIANRVGDFGVLLAVFLMLWAFGTLDFYKPNEIPNPNAGQHHHGDEHGEDGDHADDGEHADDEDHSESDDHAEEEGDQSEGEEGAFTAPIELVMLDSDVPMLFAEEHGEEGDHGDAAAHGDEDGHGAERHMYSFADEGVDMGQLGIFGQVATYVAIEAEADDLVKAAEDKLDEARRSADETAIANAEAALAVVEEEADSLRTTFHIGSLELSLEALLVLVTLFMLLGVTGKSAQIPLFVWLPDAMAGPTPVSALIHAATMVTAGVYMMVRSNILFYNAELTSFIVAVIGATTAIVAGFIAVGQFDIKRVLAYSTISQLGFMVAVVGLGGYVAAMFHMITHAFFKALLFLGSGSVIHGVEHGHHHAHEHGHGDDHEEEFDPQDMRNMGGLSKKMPITYYTYLAGTLALAGIWPFAGFWSKDEILAKGWIAGFDDGKLQGFIVLGLLLIAAGFTAFYMWRQIEMVFHGEPRTEAAEHAPESATSMVIPLMILGFFSVFIGFINIPGGLGFPFTFGFEGSIGLHSLGNFLEYSIFEKPFGVLPPFNPLLAIIALSVGIGAIFVARGIYGGNKAVVEVKGQVKDPLQANPGAAPIFQLANDRLYWDDIYFAVIINPYMRLADFLANVIDWGFLHDYFHDSVIMRGYQTVGQLLARPFDLGIIDGAVNGVGWVVSRISGLMRQTQTGYVRTYAVALLLGVVAVIVLMLLPLLQIG